MTKLLNGYENRIRDFVLKMVENPIVVRKNKDKYMTTRQELYASSSNKILDKKGFIFKSYKSDKERINEIIKNKEILDNYLSKNNSKRKKQEFVKKLKQINYFQPSMRFKKRTDIEKIYDVFKKKEHLNTEQKSLYNELIKMGLIHPNCIKYEYDDDNDYDNNLQMENNRPYFNSTDNIFYNKKYKKNLINNDSLSDEDKYKKILHDKILTERKNMLIKRKAILNLGNKIKKINKEKIIKLKDEEYQKTHFKAMENLTIFKTSTMDHKLFKTWSLEDLIHQHNLNESKKIFYKTISTNFPKFENKKNIKNNFFKNKLKKGLFNNIKNININDIESNNNKILTINDNFNNNNKRFSLTKYNELSNNNKRKKEFNLLNEEKLLKDLEISKEIMNSNPLLFKLFFKNYKNEINLNNQNKMNKNSFSLDKLKAIRKIAFRNNKEEYNFSNNNEEDNYYDDFKKEENIIIDGKFYKKSDTDKIAEKLLKKCNWNNSKVNYKNMEGRGKLMFTNGLTVKEFEMKYGILP